MTKRALRAIALLMLASAPALAADYPFTVTNKTDADMVSINVRDGQINGFKRVAQGGQRSFTITLPDGVCETRLQFNFNDSDSLTMNDYDACNGEGVEVAY
jgi:hypothetical protein